MKNTMRNCNWILVMGLLIVLSCAMEAKAVDYRNSYQPSVNGGLYRAGMYQEATAPVATFQSTSAYSSPEWAESATPMLNSDGTVNGSAYMGGPRRLGSGPSTPTPSGTNGPGTPDEPEDENQQPLGDALLPLFLLACAYAVYKVSRRRKLES